MTKKEFSFCSEKCIGLVKIDTILKVSILTASTRKRYFCALCGKGFTNDKSSFCKSFDVKVKYIFTTENIHKDCYKVIKN